MQQAGTNKKCFCMQISGFKSMFKAVKRERKKLLLFNQALNEIWSLCEYGVCNVQI